MTKTTLIIGTKECLLYADENPSALLIQPIDFQHNEMLSKEITYISKNINIPYAIAAFPVNSWNFDLSWNGMKEITLETPKYVLLRLLSGAWKNVSLYNESVLVKQHTRSIHPQ